MLRYSEFDSELLKRRVGRATVEGLTPASLRELRDEQIRQGMDLIIIRDSRFDFSTVHRLPWEDLRLSDVKILSRAGEFPSQGAVKEGFSFSQEWRSDDLEPLQEMVAEIAEVSQYRALFGREVALKLYHKWLWNSLTGEVADHCFIVRSEINGKPAGLVAVKMEGEIAEATLVAAGKEYRGTGTGRFLLSNVLFRLGELGARSCLVATQITNRSALRFYNSLGFRFDSYRVDFVVSA